MPLARKREEQPWLRYILLPLLLIIFGLLMSSFVLPKTVNAPSVLPFIPTPTPTSTPAKHTPTLTITPSPSSGKYSCPQTSWVDCMPIVPPERKEICSKTYLHWAQKNCPNFVGVSY